LRGLIHDTCQLRPWPALLQSGMPVGVRRRQEIVPIYALISISIYLFAE
jgi:hypothetical protein